MIEGDSEDLVSVLVPAYNAAASIRETIDSALRQTYPRFEVVVVDDGSRDDTYGIVQGMARDDPRIVLIQQPNAGVAAARNRALAAARGTLVAPLDADDLWHPDKLTRQVKRLREADENVGVVYCWSAEIDSSSKVIGRRLDLDRYEGAVYAPLVVTNFLSSASVPLIRKTPLDEVGGWDVSLRTRQAQGCEDWQLYLRLAERWCFALEPAFLVGYRQTATAMSRHIRQMRRSYRLVMREARQSHPEVPPALFRWSRAAFDFYTAETLQGNGYGLLGAVFLLAGMARDPTWIGRPSTRKKFRRWLRRHLGKDIQPHAAIANNVHFRALDPDSVSEVPEGKRIASRRKQLGAIQISSRRP